MLSCHLCLLYTKNQCVMVGSLESKRLRGLGKDMRTIIASLAPIKYTSTKYKIYLTDCRQALYCMKVHTTILMNDNMSSFITIDS